MVGHGGSSVGSYLADPTSPIPSHCASIVMTSTLRVKMKTDNDILYCFYHNVYIHKYWAYQLYNQATKGSPLIYMYFWEW